MPMPCGCRRPCCSADCWCPPSARRRCLPTLPGCALPCRPRIARTMSRNSSRRCMRSPKPVLVLLHGWGMNGRVFDTLAARLADAFEVRAPHLPGHGGRDALAVNTLHAWADNLARQLPDGATLLGWSLGGQVAMRAALDHPRKIRRLILLASTPRFVTTDDWPRGMAAADLQAFGAALLADPETTLLAAPVASAAALAGGLAILRDTDLRAELPQLAQPTLVLHGALDALTPAAAGAWLADVLPAAQHVEYARAAHRSEEHTSELQSPKEL